MIDTPNGRTLNRTPSYTFSNGTPRRSSPSNGTPSRGHGYSRYIHSHPRPDDGPMNGFPIRRKTMPLTPEEEGFSSDNDSFIGHLMAVRRKLSNGHSSNGIGIGHSSNGIGQSSNGSSPKARRRKRKQGIERTPLVSSSRGEIRPPVRLRGSPVKTTPAHAYSSAHRHGYNSTNTHAHSTYSPPSRLMTKVAKKCPGISVMRTMKLMEDREREERTSGLNVSRSASEANGRRRRQRGSKGLTAHERDQLQRQEIRIERQKIMDQVKKSFNQSTPKGTEIAMKKGSLIEKYRKQREQKEKVREQRGSLVERLGNKGKG